jgi:hypothetical protein
MQRPVIAAASDGDFGHRAIGSSGVCVPAFGDGENKLLYNSLTPGSR